MKRTLERILIAAAAAATAFAISTAVGQGTTTRGGFIDIPRGQTARFLGTTSTCVNPKGQIPGGQVACAVLYTAPRNMAQLASIASRSLSTASTLESRRAAVRP